MAGNFAIDTNVLIYLHDSSAPEKRIIAAGLLADKPKLSSQVVSEYLNTCRRLLRLEKAELLKQTAALFEGCPVISITQATLQYAAKLTERYQFQLFDAIIVAAPLRAIVPFCILRICSTNWPWIKVSPSPILLYNSFEDSEHSLEKQETRISNQE